MIFTAQNIAQVDSFLRRLTQYVTRVRAYPAPSIERRERGKRPWFFIVQRFQPEDVDTLNPEKRLSRALVRYRREHEDWYSTDELVHPPKRLRGRTARGDRVVPSGPGVGAPLSGGEAGTGPLRPGAPEAGSRAVLQA